jgi:hypothetical protein
MVADIKALSDVFMFLALRRISHCCHYGSEISSIDSNGIDMKCNFTIVRRKNIKFPATEKVVVSLNNVFIFFCQQPVSCNDFSHCLGC